VHAAGVVRATGKTEVRLRKNFWTSARLLHSIEIVRENSIRPGALSIVI
jgi:hypothetical protein